MKRQFSDLANNLEGQKMFQVLQAAKELEKLGRKIIHFEIGEPDFDTPANIVKACVNALESGDTHYTISIGLEEFRHAAAQSTLRSRGFLPDIDQILVTPGGNVQIYYALACTTNPGEDVICIDPSFVSYNSIMRMMGINPIHVPLLEENEFRVYPEDIENAITDKTRMIIINSPHNPTGSVMTEEDMKAVYDIAEKHDIYLLSDEVYGRMIYHDANTSFHSPSAYDHCKTRTIVIHSFSKTFAMTGWRIGGVTGPKELISRMALLLETTSSCVSPFIQRGAIEALIGPQDEIDAMCTTLRKRRDLMVEGINRIEGLSCLLPKGAFYVFMNIKKTGLSSEEYSHRLLHEAGVATCPGSFFGPSGEGYVRFCYAGSEDLIREGLERMAEFQQKLELTS
jgi:aspartate/methionine/tyrosine aminotransferase